MQADSVRARTHGSQVLLLGTWLQFRSTFSESSLTLTDSRSIPSIPHEWDGFTATRQFRGATYNITVKNPDHVCKGVKAMTVDGKAVDGNVIPVCDGGVHEVEVVLG